MLYILGPNTLDHYAYPTAEVTFGTEAARAFAAAGVPATVLWGGGARDVGGVPHRPGWGPDAPTLGASDTLLVMHSLLGVAVARESAYARLRGAGRRWLWASSPHTEGDGRLAFRDAWAWYGRLWHDATGATEVVRASLPSARVGHCLTGVPRDLDVAALADPFPADGRRHLVFVGRWRDAAWWRRLLAALDDRYAVHVAAPTLTPDAGAGRVFHVHRGATGSPPAPPAAGLTSIGLGEARALFADLVPDRRVEFLGPLPFGMFWAHHHFAFATLDHGFAALGALAPINSKVLDPLAVGGRVAADGLSPTFALLGRYGAGATVPSGDAPALAALLDSWSPEATASRTARGAAFRAAESWHVRARQMLADAAGDPP